MKFLLVPENNSLSHVAKCLAIRDRLAELGHDSLLAASERNAAFVRGLGRNCAVLPDLQEADGAAFPTVNWFSSADRIDACIKAEVALMEGYRPDRVLGVFRFTTKAAARLARVPYDSLVCGCLLPWTEEILGFDPCEEGAELQRQYLDLFFRYAGDRIGAVMKRAGLEGLDDVRETFVGERTFLWDFPEFAAVGLEAGVRHVGPIAWHSWPHDDENILRLLQPSSPLALVSFGTCIHSVEGATRMVRALVELGYQVILAAGGQTALLKAAIDHPRVTVCHFAPLHLLYPHAKLLICHGGQMTVLEALAHGVPVLVMPLQPEQAHNGLCLERLGAGRRLLPPVVFRGDSSVYTKAFDSMNDDHLRTVVSDFASQVDGAQLLRAQRMLDRFDGVRTLCDHLVR